MPRFPSRSFAALFSGVLATVLVMSTGHAADEEAATARLLLSHLPLKTSRAYHDLLRAAGSPHREILPMTKAETWLVPPGRVADLRRRAKAAGVTVTEVDDAQFDALQPMQHHAMTAPQTKMMHEAMNERATMGVSMMALAPPESLEYALTRPGEGASIRLKLSDTVTVVAVRSSLMKEGDSYLWQGEVEGTFEPVSLVYWPQGRLTGTIRHDGRLYTVKSFGGDMHGVIETAPAMLPPEHAPMSGPAMQKLNMHEDPLKMRGDAGAIMDHMKHESERLQNLKDETPVKSVEKIALNHPGAESKLGAGASLSAGPVSSIITLIVAYTHAAAGHYQDIAKDLIALAVAEANLSLVRSGIGDVRFEVVHSYQSGYVEQGSHFDHMFRFAEKGDGYADEIHALRDKYRADIAVMIVDDGNGCGLSAGVAPPAERAFAVVHHGCAAATYSLAHEIGHIIGARHDAGFDDTATPFPYGHGYVNGKKWRTMMSYEQSCDGCPRVPVWSSPEVAVRGEPAGNQDSNNARVIKDGAARVAAFR